MFFVIYFIHSFLIEQNKEQNSLVTEEIGKLDSIEGLLNLTSDYIDSLIKEENTDMSEILKMAEANFQKLNEKIDQIISSYQLDNKNFLIAELPIALETVKHEQSSIMGLLKSAFMSSSEKLFPNIPIYDGLIVDDLDHDFVFTPINPDDCSPNGIQFKPLVNIPCQIKKVKTKFYLENKLVYKQKFELEENGPLKFDFNTDFSFDKMILKAKKNKIDGKLVCLPSFSLFTIANTTTI